MRRICAMAAAALVAASVMADQYAGRTSYTMFANNASAAFDHSRYRDGIRLASLEIAYSAPFTGTVTISTEKNGIRVVRYTIQVTAASSIVYVPDALWFKKTDKVIVTNSSGAACSLVLEYVE